MELRIDGDCAVYETLTFFGNSTQFLASVGLYVGLYMYIYVVGSIEHFVMLVSLLLLLYM